MIQYLDWIPQLESVEGVRFVKNEIMVFSYSDIMTLVKRENPFHYQTISTPHKFDFSMFIFHKEGHFRLKIDMEEYEIDTPYNFIRILPGQIVSFENNTPDFDADVVIMSQSFMEDMGVYMRTLFDFRLRTKMGYVTRCQNDEEIAIADFFCEGTKTRVGKHRESLS